MYFRQGDTLSDYLTTTLLLRPSLGRFLLGDRLLHQGLPVALEF
jgi:hypothetical protein